jgi:hypothetical protein
MERKRNQYTKEYKIEAVRLIVEEGRPISEVARESTNKFRQSLSIPIEATTSPCYNCRPLRWLLPKANPLSRNLASWLCLLRQRVAAIRRCKARSKASITNITCSSITDNTRERKTPVTPSIIHATHQIDPNYYIQKGLEALEAMHPPQYH